LDAESNIVAQKNEANLSYLDETGLSPDTEYSGRRVVVFNDRGESLSSSLAVFPAVHTLAEEMIEEEIIEEEIAEEEIIKEEVDIKEEVVEEEPSLFETIQQKIAEIQRQINDLFNQLAELLQQSAATVKSFLASLWITLF